MHVNKVSRVVRWRNNTGRYLLGGGKVDQRQDEHEEAVVHIGRLHNGAALGRQEASQDVGLGAFHIKTCSTRAGVFGLAVSVDAVHSPSAWFRVRGHPGKANFYSTSLAW